jgi:sugar lactone lactonase YvrE
MIYSREFYDELFLNRDRELFVKINLLTWTELKIKEIQGLITSGSLSADGNSAVRRTINFTMLLDPNTYFLPEVANEVGISRKISIYVGLKNKTQYARNPNLVSNALAHLSEPIIYFNLGVFIPSSVDLSHSIDNSSISISAQDKMCLLNGDIGGELGYDIDFVNSITNENTAYIDIIKDTVSFFGGIDETKIVVADLPYFAESLTRVTPPIINGTITSTNIAAFAGPSFSVSTQEPNSTGVFFKPDGTQMYVIGGVRRIFQYALSTPWSVSTATSNTSSPLFDSSTIEADFKDLFFKPDGTRVYLIGYNQKAIHQYTLALPWTTSSLVTGSVITSSRLVQESAPEGLFFKPEGDKVYTVGSTNDKIYEYSLSLPWTVSSINITGSLSFSLVASNSVPRGLVTDAIGEYIYVLNQPVSGSSSVFRYNFNSPFSLATATFSGLNFAPSFLPQGAQGLTYDATENKLHIVSSTTDKVHQFIGQNKSVTGLSGDTSFLVVGKNLVYLSGNGAFGTSSTITSVGTDGFSTSKDNLLEGPIVFTVNPVVSLFTTTAGSYGKRTFDSSGSPLLSGTALTPSLDGNKILPVQLVLSPSNKETKIELSSTNKVTDILEKIKSDLLGNYEYFFDVNGNFIFQFKRNLQSDFSSTTLFQDDSPSKYFAKFNAIPFLYDFSDKEIVSAYNQSPNWKGIKNDFYIYGKNNILFHVAIDSKPIVPSEFYTDGVLGSYNQPWQQYIIDLAEYNATTTEDRYYVELKKYFEYDPIFNTGIYKKTSATTGVWRYRLTGVETDDFNADFPDGDPFSWNYFFDIIDDNSKIGKFSINAIGRRVKSIQNNNIDILFPRTLEPDYLDSTSASVKVILYDDVETESLNVLSYSIVAAASATMVISGFAKPTVGDRILITGAETFTSSAASVNGLWDIKSIDGNSLKFSISGSTLNSSFSVASQEATAEDLFFKPEGDKLYVIGRSGDDINQYNLSSSWSVSSAVFSGSSAALTTESDPQAMFFKPDGTKVFVVGFSKRRILQYNLTVPWAIGTLSNSTLTNSTFQVADNNPNSLFFKPEGDKVFIVGPTEDKIYEYSLTSAWTASSTVNGSVSFSLSGLIQAPRALAFNTSGTQMFVLEGDGIPYIYKFNLPTPWSIATASYSRVFYTPPNLSAAGSSSGIIYNKEINKTYLITPEADAIFEYSDLIQDSYIPMSDGKLTASFTGSTYVQANVGSSSIQIDGSFNPNILNSIRKGASVFSNGIAANTTVSSFSTIIGSTTFTTTTTTNYQFVYSVSYTVNDFSSRLIYFFFNRNEVVEQQTFFSHPGGTATYNASFTVFANRNFTESVTIQDDLLPPVINFTVTPSVTDLSTTTTTTTPVTTAVSSNIITINLSKPLVATIPLGTIVDFTISSGTLTKVKAFQDNNISSQNIESELEAISTPYVSILKSQIIDSLNNSDFTYKSDGFSAMKDLLYTHTNYNETVSVSSIPIYFLEPNNVITLSDINTQITGDHYLQSFDIPLSPDGLMSMNAIKIQE